MVGCGYWFGSLVAPGDSEGMAHKVSRLLNSPQERLRMGEAAAADAGRRYSLDQQASAYVNWYEEIIDQQKK